MKIIEVVPYNPDWLLSFEIEAGKIKEALGDNCIEVHHIGSTSVPGLSSKPFLDVLLILHDTKRAIKDLEAMGFEYRSEYNVPFRLFFRNNQVATPIKLHVVPIGHGHADLQLCFRNYLRNYPQIMKEYQNLKLNLVIDDSSFERGSGGFANYTLRKNDFIKHVLDMAGFKSLILNLCLHEAEWKNYHRIRIEQIFAPINVVYDENHPSLTAKNNFHFVLYKGTKIICVAHVEFLNESGAAIRSLATDEPYKRNGYGTYMMKLLEKWIKSQGHNIIKLHANPNAEHFYRSLGVINMEFDDVSISDETIDLGKMV